MIKTIINKFRNAWRSRKYLSLLKLVNILLVNIQWKLKTTYVLGYPYRVRIEPTNICNTQCQLCPTGLRYKGRKKGVMEFDSFKKIFDEQKRFIYDLDFTMWGDSLILDSIYDMVHYAESSGVRTHISSNLHAFDPSKHGEKLVKSGLNMLTCSLHGASQETYQIYQPGKNFIEIVDKIKAIQATKKKLGSKTPYIGLNYIVTKSNQHELESFIKLAKQMDCTPQYFSPCLNLQLFVCFDKDLNRIKMTEEQLAEKVFQLTDKWLPNNDNFILPVYKKLNKGNEFYNSYYNGNKIKDCPWPWKMTVINWDGNVSVCCGIYNPKDDFGNILKTPFKVIWNNKKYQIARECNKHKVPTTEEYNSICRNCPGMLV